MLLNVRKEVIRNNIVVLPGKVLMDMEVPVSKGLEMPCFGSIATQQPHKSGILVTFYIKSNQEKTHFAL